MREKPEEPEDSLTSFSQIDRAVLAVLKRIQKGKYATKSSVSDVFTKLKKGLEVYQYYSCNDIG